MNFDFLAGDAERAQVLARIQALCELPDGQAGCWLWRGCRSNVLGGKPVMSFRGKQAPVRRVVFFLREGFLPPAGMWVTCCGNPACVSMHCARAMLQHHAQLRAARRGAYSRPEANRARRKSARGRAQVAQTVVEQVLSMPGSNAEAARATGLSRAYVGDIRRGKTRKPLGANAVQVRVHVKRAAAVRAEQQAAREHAEQVQETRLQALRKASRTAGVWAGLMA
jgi:hypothetical protein